MKFGINLAFRDPGTLVRCARKAAGFGFDWIGVVDSPFLFCESTVAATLVALNSHACQLGPVVTNPVTRSIDLIAAQLATLDAVSHGRAVLGLGSGDTAVANQGLRSATVAEMEAAILRFRELSFSGPSGGDGRFPHIPVVLAAGGPRMINLAGRLGDGVLLSCGISPEVVESQVSEARASAASSSRPHRPFEVWVVGLCFFMDESGQDASRGDLSSLLAAFAHHSLRRDLETKAVRSEFSPGLAALARSYQAQSHLEPSVHNEALMEELGLIDFLAERYLLGPSPERVVDQVHSLERLGVDGIMLTGTTRQREHVVELFGQKILPRFRAAS